MRDLVISVSDEAAESLLNGKDSAVVFLSSGQVKTIRPLLPTTYYCRYKPDAPISENRWYRIWQGKEPSVGIAKYYCICTRCGGEVIAVFPADEEPEQRPYRCSTCGEFSHQHFQLLQKVTSEEEFIAYPACRNKLATHWSNLSEE